MLTESCVKEAKKMKIFRRLIFKQFVQVEGLWPKVSELFAETSRNVSRTFVELCMDTPYWCTVLVHQYGRPKSTQHLEFTFSIKALSFHSRTSIREHKHIF